MSRREIVLLVSRAIAIMWIVPQLIEAFIFLPEQAFQLSGNMRLQHSLLQHGLPGANIPISPIAWLLVSEIARVIVLLVIGVLFWRCGPMIERLLLPVQGEPGQ